MWFKVGKAVIAALLLYSCHAKVADTPVWQLIDNSQLPTSAQQFKRVVDKLRQNSPSGLPSLRWVLIQPHQAELLFNGGKVSLTLPTGATISASGRTSQSNSLRSQKLVLQKDGWKVTLHRHKSALSGTLTNTRQRWKLLARDNIGVLYLEAELRSFDPQQSDGLKPKLKPELKPELKPNQLP